MVYCCKARQSVVILMGCCPDAEHDAQGSGGEDAHIEAGMPETNSGFPTTAAAAVGSNPSNSSNMQHLSLPNHIHSESSLVCGTAAKRRSTAAQADASRDPLSTSTSTQPLRDQTEIGRASVSHEQAHWQDDYATNWDRVGIGRHESLSDAAAAAMQQVSSPAGLLDESGVRGSKGKAWVCGLCTFAANPCHSIRCEVCESVRGSTLREYRPPDVAAGMDTDAGRGHTASAREPAAVALVNNFRGKKQSSKQQQRSIAGFLGPWVHNHADAVLPSLEVDEPTSRQGSPDVEGVQQHSNVSAWVRVDFHTEVRWQCAKCKCWFQTGQKAEHDDYHLALDMHQHANAVCTVPGIGIYKKRKTCKATPD